jgi:hypothetical protein
MNLKRAKALRRKVVPRDVQQRIVIEAGSRVSVGEIMRMTNKYRVVQKPKQSANPARNRFTATDPKTGAEIKWRPMLVLEDCPRRVYHILKAGE